MKITLRIFALFSTVLALSACNTIEGLGKDIQKGGEKIEKAADKAK